MEYIALFVNFVSRNHQEHSDMWNQYTSRKYKTSDQVMRFLEVADQLVFIMEIFEKKDSDNIQEDAIRKVIAITTSGGRGTVKCDGRGGSRAPFNNRQGQDNSKEFVHSKQQASQAAQESKQQRKLIEE
jgi:hypothetical protein